MTYKQESENIAIVDVGVCDVVSLISLDVILDLVEVAVSNAFAVLALLVAPDENRHDDTLSNYEQKGISALNQQVEEIIEVESDLGGENKKESGTINVVVSASNLTLVLLDDPTSIESRAILSSVNLVDVHYYRDYSLQLVEREIKESLHLSVKDLQVLSPELLNHSVCLNS